MRRALAITHVAFEDLGSLEPELVDAGFDIEVIDACTADLRAIDPGEADLLVVLVVRSESMSARPTRLSGLKSR